MAGDEDNIIAYLLFIVKGFINILIELKYKY